MRHQPRVPVVFKSFSRVIRNESAELHVLFKLILWYFILEISFSFIICCCCYHFFLNCKCMCTEFEAAYFVHQKWRTPISILTIDFTCLLSLFCTMHNSPLAKSIPIPNAFSCLTNKWCYTHKTEWYDIKFSAVWIPPMNTKLNWESMRISQPTAHL